MDQVQHVETELDTLKLSYNVDSIQSLKSFIGKVRGHTRDLNDFNKVARIQRVRVVINKY